MKINYFSFSTLLLLLSITLKSQVNFQWVKWAGAANDDFGTSVAVDGSGNVYTTGYFSGTVDFDPGPGTTTITAVSEDIFITKFDVSGSFVWVKVMGGLSSDRGKSITLDAFGNIYTTGGFGGTADFDPGAGTSTITSTGGFDIFVSKLDASGNFVWAKSMGGVFNEAGYGIAVDGSGNVYTTGEFYLTCDFDPSASTNTITSAGNNDAFISKLNSSGSFVWAKSIGGTDMEAGNDLKLDASGNVYTTGFFRGVVDFDPGASSFTLTSAGQAPFISKLDASGNFVFAKALMSDAFANFGNAITLDASGNIYSTGVVNGIIDYDPGAGTYTIIPSMPGNSDIYVSKLDASGNFVWAKQFGGGAGDGGRSIAVDAASNVFTTGYFDYQGDFDPGAGTFTLTSPGNSVDAFISKLDAAGNFVWAKNYGGTAADYGSDIEVEPFASGAVYVTGDYSGTADFDPGIGTATMTASARDIYTLKLSQGPTGITQLTADNNLSVYPNPSNGTFYLQVDKLIGEASVILINTIGQTVLKQKISEGNNTIATKNLPQGLYSCMLLQNNTSISLQKLIIE